MTLYASNRCFQGGQPPPEHRQTLQKTQRGSVPIAVSGGH